MLDHSNDPRYEQCPLCHEYIHFINRPCECQDYVVDQLKLKGNADPNEYWEKKYDIIASKTIRATSFYRALEKYTFGVFNGRETISIILHCRGNVVEGTAFLKPEFNMRFTEDK